MIWIYLALNCGDDINDDDGDKPELAVKIKVKNKDPCPFIAKAT